MEEELIDLLEIMFSEYEYGTPCYENPDENEGYLGMAFRLDDVTFHRIAEILNERRPRVTPNVYSAP